MVFRILSMVGLLLIIPGFGQTRLYVAPAGDDSGEGTSPGSPLASLARARDLIRQRRAAGTLEGPVEVNLRGGVYHLTEPLVLGPEDSGTAQRPITYQAYPGEQPVLSGGRRIGGWRRRADGSWSAPVPRVEGRSWTFRSLYVDGQRRPRARTPNQGFFRVAGFPDGKPPEVDYQHECRRFEYAPGDLDPDWTNLSDVEVIVYHFWTDSHLRVESIDAASRIVSFRDTAGKVFTDDFTDDGARYVVENVLEALDEPGEWYLDRSRAEVIYRPLPGEDPNRLEIVAPFLSAFIQGKGNPQAGAFLEHVHFRNLTFEYNHFELAPGDANDQQASASVPAAIRLQGARNCSLTHCRLAHLGTYAIEVAAGSSENRFADNDLFDLGAGGIRISGGTADDPPWERTARNRIEDNEIRYYGAVFPSAVGILLQQTEGNQVAHNHIHHGWYTAVSVGWSWGYQRSISRDNLIECNHIHDIGQGLLSDMGGIYTLGVSPGTILRHNWIHDVDAHGYGGWGIYNDEGSTHILVEDNVVSDTKFAGYDIHYAKEITVRNNIFAFGRLQQLNRTRVEPHDSVYFENNIVYWTEGPLLDGDWSDLAHPFYFHPLGEDGTREVTHTARFDWNLYYNPEQAESEVPFAGGSWAEWRQRGQDRHSLYTDPGFIDAARRDFRLRDDSPALRLGFRPIQLESVGPRNPVGPGPARAAPID